MKIEAILKRNNLIHLVGDFFMDAETDFIKAFNLRREIALFGIKKSDNIYTVICKYSIIYNSNSGEQKINHGDFLELLQRNALKYGKQESIEYLKIDMENSIFVLNSETMNAIWNTILILERVNRGKGKIDVI